MWGVGGEGGRGECDVGGEGVRSARSPGDSLDGVVDGQDVNPLPVLDVGKGSYTEQDDRDETTRDTNTR